MSSVIIDGYNVIGTDHRDAEKVREVFISRLIAYRKATGHDITVVFDAYNRGSLRETAAVRGGVKVIFTRHGDRADDVIKRIIADKSRERIVITSDRDIEHFAWSAGSIPVPSDLFSEILKDHGRDRQSGQDGGGSAEETRDPDEPDYAGSRPRGNPHRMSRREKALRRALGKL